MSWFKKPCGECDGTGTSIEEPEAPCFVCAGSGAGDIKILALIWWVFMIIAWLNCCRIGIEYLVRLIR